jgi:hypothetical protein
MNYYLTSQLIAQHQAALTADVRHRAQLKEARAARESSTWSAHPRTRIGRLFLGRLAPAA